MAAYGAGSLEQLRPGVDNQQKAAQFYQMARQGMSAPPVQQEKTASGAVLSGLSGVTAGKQLAGMLPSASKGAAGLKLGAEALGTESAVSEFAAPAIGSAMAGVADAAIPSAVASTAAPIVATEAGIAGAGLAAGLTTVAPWAVGALALGSYIFG